MEAVVTVIHVQLIVLDNSLCRYRSKRQDSTSKISGQKAIGLVQAGGEPANKFSNALLGHYLNASFAQLSYDRRKIILFWRRGSH